MKKSGNFLPFTDTNFHRCVHKNPALDPFHGQMIPVQILFRYFFNKYFNIILLSTPRSPKLYFPSGCFFVVSLGRLNKSGKASVRMADDPT